MKNFLKKFEKKRALFLIILLIDFLGFLSGGFSVEILWKIFLRVFGLTFAVFPDGGHP